MVLSPSLVEQRVLSLAYQSHSSVAAFVKCVHGYIEVEITELPTEGFARRSRVGLVNANSRIRVWRNGIGIVQILEGETALSI